MRIHINLFELIINVFVFIIYLDALNTFSKDGATCLGSDASSGVDHRRDGATWRIAWLDDDANSGAAHQLGGATWKNGASSQVAAPQHDAIALAPTHLRHATWQYFQS